MTLGPSELLKGQVPYEHVEFSHNMMEVLVLTSLEKKYERD